MALPWIKVHSNLRRHPKTLALSDAVEQDHAWCYLVALWSWAAEFCPSGVLSGRAVPRAVEREAGWNGQPGVLFDALVETGWLTADSDAVKIHGWEEHQLPHIEHAKREAARQKAIRERRKVPLLLESEDGTEDRTRTDTRTVARPDRDREEERDKELSTKNLALFENRKGAGEGQGKSFYPSGNKPRRGRTPKDKSPEAEAERLAEKTDADRWMDEARKLTGLTEDELRWSQASFLAFRRQRKARGVEQLLRALEGLQNDLFSKTAGLGWLVSDSGITKGLAKWKKEAATTHPNRNWDDPKAGDLDSWL